MQEPPACWWAALSSTSVNSLKRPPKPGTVGFLCNHTEGFWFVQVKTHVTAAWKILMTEGWENNFSGTHSVACVGLFPGYKFTCSSGKSAFKKPSVTSFPPCSCTSQHTNAMWSTFTWQKSANLISFLAEIWKPLSCFNGASPNSLLLPTWTFCHLSFSPPLFSLSLPHLQTPLFAITVFFSEEQWLFNFPPEVEVCNYYAKQLSFNSPKFPVYTVISHFPLYILQSGIVSLEH